MTLAKVFFVFPPSIVVERRLVLEVNWLSRARDRRLGKRTKGITSSPALVCRCEAIRSAKATDNLVQPIPFLRVFILDIVTNCQV